MSRASDVTRRLRDAIFVLPLIAVLMLCPAGDVGLALLTRAQALPDLSAVGAIGTPTGLSRGLAMPAGVDLPFVRVASLSVMVGEQLDPGVFPSYAQCASVSEPAAVNASTSATVPVAAVAARPPAKPIRRREITIRTRITDGHGRILAKVHAVCDDGAEVNCMNILLLPPEVSARLEFRPADLQLTTVSGSLLTGLQPLMADVPVTFLATDGTLVVRLVRVYDSPACVYPLLFGRCFTDADDAGMNRDVQSSPLAPYLRGRAASVFDDRRRTITGLPPELAVRLKLRPDANKRSLMQPLRRVSVQERDVIAGFVDELLAAGVIEHSQSPFGANVVLVRKKTGEGMAGYRMCVDFRQLNRAIEHTQEAWPMRRSDDCVARLAGCKYFTSVDFRSGFWQLPIAQEDKHLLAFRTHSGHFNFSVLPMGLSSASGCFQRVTEFICSGLTDRLDDDRGIADDGDEGEGQARPLVNGGRADDLCIPYIDDVLLATRGTADDHLDKVERFLARLGEHTVTLRYDKCSFAMSSVDFLGFHVGRKGLQAQTQLVEKLTSPP